MCARRMTVVCGGVAHLVLSVVSGHGSLALARDKESSQRPVRHARPGPDRPGATAVPVGWAARRRGSEGATAYLVRLR